MFVTFEGIGGAGKTTQARLLRDWLVSLGREVVDVREPGGTQLGERLREVLLSGTAMSVGAETALFAAARAELAHEVILPGLSRGADVVSDRYIDSSLVYQGIVKGADFEAVLDVNLALTAGLMPDRTFLLLIPPSEARRRRLKLDAIETGDIGLLEALDRAYREIASRFPDRIVTVDAERPSNEVAADIRKELAAHV